MEKRPTREELLAWSEADYAEIAACADPGRISQPTIGWAEFFGGDASLPTFGPGEEEEFRLYRRHFERLCRALFKHKDRVVHVRVRRNGTATIYFNQ